MQKREGIEGCVIVSTVSILLNNVVRSVTKESDTMLSKLSKLVEGFLSQERVEYKTVENCRPFLYIAPHVLATSSV